MILYKYSFNITGNCNAWRQTGKCSPDGPREPHHDKDCLAEIYYGMSGYCECADETVRMRKGCEAGLWATCFEACNSGK